MKSVKLFGILSSLLVVSLLFNGCAKDANTPPASGIEQMLIKNIWSVDYYFHDQDLTGSYSSSRLLFSITGAVGYEKSSEITAGKWNRTVDASNNELISLQFNTSDANIGALNQEWQLTESSSGMLQFEKNDGASTVIFRIKTQ